jgi:hypothetical protein
MSTSKEFNIRMVGIKELTEGYDVEIACRPSEDYRWVIKAKNEGGNNETLIDLWDIINWMRFGPCAGRIQKGFRLPFDENCVMED